MDLYLDQSVSVHGRFTLVQTAPVSVMFAPLAAHVPIAESNEFIWATSVAMVFVPVIGEFKMLRPLHKMESRGISYVPVALSNTGKNVSVVEVLGHGSFDELYDCAG